MRIKALLMVVLIILITIMPVSAEVLRASISKSTGIVGLDMLIGQEPIPIVRQVFPGTPADKSGFQPGDRILEINNTPTYYLSSLDIDIAISDIPGEQIKFKVLRYNKPKLITLTVANADNLPPSTHHSFFRDY